MNMDGMTYDELDLSGEKSVADKWILTRLNETIEHVTQLADRYEFGEVGRHLYNFIWDDFCDWYIEMASFRFMEKTKRLRKLPVPSLLTYLIKRCVCSIRLCHS